MNLGFDFNMDFDTDAFDTINFEIESPEKSRYIKPPLSVVNENYCKYKYAKNLAKQISIVGSERVYAIIDGSFIFGDFIEALLVEKGIQAKEMFVSTLSMSQENIDSFHNLLKNDYILELNIIISDYFYSHERHNLIPYMYERLDIDNRFQLSVAKSHCKITILKTNYDHNIVIHGSANLRSSNNIEQIMVENNESLYNFNKEIFLSITEKYKTINKSLLGNTLWQAVQKSTK